MSKIWVQLGRFGDLMAIFPLLWDYAQKGGKHGVMVSREYASIFDGISYASPVVYEGPHFEVAKACEEASRLNDEVLCTQTNGPIEEVRKWTYKTAGQETARTTSYTKEMWKVAGQLKRWDECLPLVFDRRDKAREEKLLDDHGFLRKGKHKRLILVSTQGNSSPFNHSELLLELLKGRFGKTHRILELPQAERIYDLLALYERAEFLVAIDSAPLHLAWAVPSLPVVALTNDKPSLWNGSPWRPNHIFYCRYGDFPERAVEMLDCMHNPREHPIVHIWNAYESRRRDGLGLPLPIRKGMCGRSVENVPYLKDCVRMAMQKPGCDYVVVGHPQALAMPPGVPLEHEACFAYRMVRTDEGATFQPTVDLFGARKSWWRAHLDEIPDYLLGRDYWWTHGLRGLFTKYGAVDVTGIVEKPASPTKEPVMVQALPPRLKHNKDLAEKAIRDLGIYSRYPKVTDQIEVVASFTGITRYGYNPTIIEHEGKTLMAYRYHPGGDARTKLELAELNDNGSIFKTIPLEIPGNSLEDPRFFKRGSQLYLSWVDSDVPRSMNSVVRWSNFESGFENTVNSELPGNDGSSTQKNWVFFEDYVIYQIQPKQVVWMNPLMFPDGYSMESEGPRWSYGAIRGGTPPLPYDGKLIRFFHGHLDNEFGQWKRRYYVGALIMEPEPPFKVIRVSKKPILYGSEIDDLKVKNRPKHFKANVVFPGGAIERDGGWWLSIGINDCSCAIVKVREKDLNL